MTTEGTARYVLITQCLQNDLFLNRDCRLYIGDDSAGKMLLTDDEAQSFLLGPSRERLSERALRHGPLGRFLHATIGEAFAGDRPPLYVVNVRDWHVPDESYDAERRHYGRHCEAGTWGAKYIDGLRMYLDPASAQTTGDASPFSRGSAWIFHVHSDSIFDFRPRWDERRQGSAKHEAAHVQRVLDVLLAGSDDDVRRLVDPSLPDPEIAPENSVQPPVYVAVVGVYTDIKVQLVLAGLRTRYELPNLAVSDTLTASRTLERHLHGLDFADKLLGVEVVHGVGDLACFLGSTSARGEAPEVSGRDDYGRYRTYFADKQNVLAYESDKLREYTQLTAKRADRVYRTIEIASRFLLLCGGAFLALAIAGSILHAVSAKRWPWELTAATGGLGLLQIVTVFFSRPIVELRQNLTNLASFRIILEGRSLKDAFTRYHLTTPEVLRELKDETDLARAKTQIDALATQLEVIDNSQRADYAALAGLVGKALDAGDAASTNGAGEPAPTPTPAP